MLFTGRIQRRFVGLATLRGGMPKLVTSNSADYEALARRLARNRGELAALRARLAASRETHPLLDMAGCTRDIEESMRRVWRQLAG